MYRGQGRGGRGGGYGGYGGYGGKGGKGGKGFPSVEQKKEIQIPDGAIGVVLGAKGKNIKELQATPGAAYARLQGTTLHIGGTPQAVQSMEMQVQASLNRFHTSGNLTQEQHLHFDVDAEQQPALRFLPASRAGAAVDFGLCQSGREFFVLGPGAGVGGLELGLAGLGLGGPGAGGAQGGGDMLVRAPMDLDEMCTAFSRVLERLPDMPRSAPLGVEVRLGVMGFHTIGPAARGDLQLKQLLRLAPHRDYKFQFVPQLRASAADLEAKLAREAFEVMDRDCRTVVHLVDIAGSRGYAVVFVEPQAGEDGDPRLTEAKRTELQRIAACRSADEVLEVAAGSPAATVKKAYFKKTLMVHPDKNGFIGATEATKLLTSAKEALDARQALRLRPPNFAVGRAEGELPQVEEFLEAKATHMKEEVVRLGGELGFRLVVTSQATTDNPTARAFLEQSWKSGGMVSGGMLEADRRYSIDAVRFKERLLLSDGHLSVALQTVRQKVLESAGRFQTSPEVEVKCPALQEALEELRARPSAEGRARAVELFRAFVGRARELAGQLSE